MIYLIVILILSGTVQAAMRPNVLVILANDCTYNDLPIYGGQNARTSALERLAQEGLVFNRAYPLRTVTNGEFRYIRNALGRAGSLDETTARSWCIARHARGFAGGQKG